jgi:hypothetical protein
MHGPERLCSEQQETNVKTELLPGKGLKASRTLRTRIQSMKILYNMRDCHSVHLTRKIPREEADKLLAVSDPRVGNFLLDVMYI